MNRLALILRYPKHAYWADHFIYFYDEDGVSQCILDVKRDKIVADFRN